MPAEDASKQAKVLFQQDAGAKNRRLLERTYLLRIEDLSRAGMPQVAAEVAKNFIEFGVTEAGLLAELVPRRLIFPTFEPSAIPLRMSCLPY